MSTKSMNRTTQLAGDLKLLAGVQKFLPNSSLVIAGKTYTTSDVVQVLKARADGGNGVLTAHSALQNAVKADRDEHASTKPFVDALKAVLLVLFANALDTLAELGLKPRKARTPPSPAARVVAAAKARATRTARHTMSAKEKAKIVGVVNAPVVVVPSKEPVVVTGGSPSPSPEPATSSGAPAAAAKG